MELQCQAVVPLFVGEFEQIALRHGTRNARQSIDAAKPVKRSPDDRLTSLRLA